MLSTLINALVIGKSISSFPVQAFYVCKPKAYEYEREIRAIILEDTEDNSINIRADVETLIENIYISPFASRWFVDLVEDLACCRYGLKDKNIYMSDIKFNKRRH